MGEEQRQVVIVVPDLMPADESKWQETAPEPLRKLLSTSGWNSYYQPAALMTPEYSLFGFDPERTMAMQGPITASAIGIEPPSNALCMHLSLVSMGEDGILKHPGLPPDRTELMSIFQTLERLQDSHFHFIQGFALDHCLVESPIQSDMITHDPSFAFGKHYTESLPLGSGDSRYRRLFEDAHELLQKLGLSEVRFENGLPPINAIWPWGGGFPLARRQMPFERGRTASYFGGDLRILGLCNSMRYPHNGWVFEPETLLDPKSDVQRLINIDYGLKGAWKNDLADPERELSRLQSVLDSLASPELDLSVHLCFSIADTEAWDITEVSAESQMAPISFEERMDRLKEETNEPMYQWFNQFLTDPDRPEWPRFLRPQ